MGSYALSYVSLAAPCFLLAVLLARMRCAEGGASHTGSPVPAPQSSYKYACSCARSAQREARRTVLIATDLLCRFFLECGVVLPVVQLELNDTAPVLNGRRKWLSVLSQSSPTLDALDELRLLRDRLQSVDALVLQDVCAAYNHGLDQARKQGISLPPTACIVEEASFTRSLIDMLPVHEVVPASCGEPVERSCRGTFYYIAAGVGCGIKELIQVLAFHDVVSTLLFKLGLNAFCLCVFTGWVQVLRSM